MYKYEKNNLKLKLPKMIRVVAKADKVFISEKAINAIVNQVMYYADNYSEKFALDKNNPWSVEIKPVPNDDYEYAVNLSLYKSSNKDYTFRELIFLAKDGKLLAIYYYKLTNDKEEFKKKTHSVSQDIINEIKEHMKD